MNDRIRNKKKLFTISFDSWKDENHLNRPVCYCILCRMRRKLSHTHTQKKRRILVTNSKLYRSIYFCEWKTIISHYISLWMTAEIKRERETMIVWKILFSILHKQSENLFHFSVFDFSAIRHLQFPFGFSFIVLDLFFLLYSL